MLLLLCCRDNVLVSKLYPGVWRRDWKVVKTFLSWSVIRVLAHGEDRLCPCESCQGIYCENLPVFLLYSPGIERKDKNVEKSLITFQGEKSKVEKNADFFFFFF